MITNKKRVHKKGVAELIILHHLEMKEMVDEFELKLSIVFMLSDRSKADSLTRIRKAWLKVEGDTAVVCCVG